MPESLESLLLADEDAGGKTDDEGGAAGGLGQRETPRLQSRDSWGRRRQT